MRQDTVHKILLSINKDWSTFEEILYIPTKVDEFKNYLNNYRGLPNISPINTFQKNEQAQQAVDNMFNFFATIFATEGLAELEVEDIKLALQEIEATVNLTLYYWYGLNDRNYQFKTWIHFFETEGFCRVFLTKSKHDFFITYSDAGLKFSLADEDRHPYILAISKPCLFQNNQLLAPQEIEDRAIFGRLRTLQREVCLMIDEWEYQNSILAVEFSQSIQQLQNLKSQQNENYHQKILNKLNFKRNFCAKWVLESLCDFQEWVNLVLNCNNNSDILAEIDALCAVILSALQKIFLPASISRMVYNQDILLLFERFAKLRLIYSPEDFSASILLQVTQSAQGFSFDSMLLDIINKKTYEWKLGVDPSASIKAFSWAYSRVHHVLLCSVLSFCYFKKSYQNLLDEFQICDLTTTFQAQDAFLYQLKEEPKFNNPVNLNTHLLKTFISIISQQFDSHQSLSEKHKDYIHFIKQNYLPLLEKFS